MPQLVDLQCRNGFALLEGTPNCWCHGRISSSNALDLFQVLDPGGLGVLSAPNLRLLVGQLSLCDYRELLRPELGNFTAVLAAADTNADLKVLPAELVSQATPRLGESLKRFSG